MKNNELDRLFRQKLQKLEQEPSLPAWQQLEEQLQQKKGRKAWFYFPGIAASLLLLFGLWAAIEYSSTILPEEPVAGKHELKKENTTGKAELPIIEKVPEPERLDVPQAYNQPAKSGGVEKEEAEKTRRERKGKPLPKSKTEPQTSTPVASASSVTPELSEKWASNLIAIEGQSFTNSISATTKSTVPEQILMEPTEAVIIQYTADFHEHEINENKESRFTESSSQEEKELSARKVIGFLKKIKSTGTGNLAELREAKDELLDFRLGKTN